MTLSVIVFVTEVASSDITKSTRFVPKAYWFGVRVMVSVTVVPWLKTFVEKPGMRLLMGKLGSKAVEREYTARLPPWSAESTSLNTTVTVPEPSSLTTRLLVETAITGGMFE